MPRKIILDCDPGHDDVIAMLLAHGNPDIELLAVTTVVVNQTLDKVTHSALAVARVAGLTGVPIAAGCPRPLVREIEVAPDIHGESGLDGPELPEPTQEVDPRHAVDLIIETVMSHEPGTVTIVPTGGLTNIAMAVRKEPRIAERVKEVVLMGSAITSATGARLRSSTSSSTPKRPTSCSTRAGRYSWSASISPTKRWPPQRLSNG